MNKLAEANLKSFLNSLGMNSIKMTDAVCPHCGTRIWQTVKPDYLVYLDHQWVECKETNARGYWPWASDIGPNGARVNQRKFMMDHSDVSWMFLLLGNERIHPLREKSGKGAWLIPWKVWLQVEEYLTSINQKNMIFRSTARSVGAADIDLLQPFRLDWSTQLRTWIAPQTINWPPKSAR